jgi:hypothetical protein
MTAVEWLFENLNIYVLSEDMKAEIKIFEQAKEMERNQIIRAINYSEMKHDELLKQAIKERRTLGEVYYDKIIKTK